MDFEIVHKITRDFKEEFNGFEVEGIDYEGNIYSLRDRSTDDMVCYDCSYNNIEFAMGKEEDLFTINERFLNYYISKLWQSNGFSRIPRIWNVFKCFSSSVGCSL